MDQTEEEDKKVVVNDMKNCFGFDVSNLRKKKKETPVVLNDSSVYCGVSNLCHWPIVLLVMLPSFELRISNANIIST